MGRPSRDARRARRLRLRETAPDGQARPGRVLLLEHRAGTPDEIMVVCQDGRSQIKNREKALMILASRLAERERERQQASEREARSSQIGSGDRSEKVRTYNFLQGRITDHRIKHTSHNLDGVLNGGELGEFTNALSAEEKRHRLEAAAAG